MNKTRASTAFGESLDLMEVTVSRASLLCRLGLSETYCDEINTSSQIFQTFEFTVLPIDQKILIFYHDPLVFESPAIWQNCESLKLCKIFFFNWIHKIAKLLVVIFGRFSTYCSSSLISILSAMQSRNASKSGRCRFFSWLHELNIVIDL